MAEKDNNISIQSATDEKMYQPLVEQISLLLAESRKNVSSAVNHIMIETYWSIGKHIVEFEQNGQAKVAYGKSPLTRLSQILTAQFGRGFSRPNLVNMRKFYLTYPNCQTLSDNLSWSHVCQLLLKLWVICQKFKVQTKTFYNFIKNLKCRRKLFSSRKCSFFRINLHSTIFSGSPQHIGF